VDIDERFRGSKVLTELRTSGADLKVVEAGLLHLTLRFLGDTDEGMVEPIALAMASSAAGMAPFDMTFSGMGAFPKPDHIRVVWIGVKGAEPLGGFVRRLEEPLARMGFEKEGDFSPHITIARVKSARHKDRLADIIRQHEGEDLGGMRVERILLKKSVLGSGGPTYSTVKEVVLGG
jgi:2'-5' RNA ligase